ncbi:14291_t:CDS:2, partial [Gigaspora rosea]
GDETSSDEDTTDRLITELKLTPLKAQVHLNKIVEQVNAIVGTYFAGDAIGEETKRHEAEKTIGEKTKRHEAEK